jgi:hypothetical protein
MASPGLDLPAAEWPADTGGDVDEAGEAAGSEASPPFRLPPIPWRLAAAGGILLLALAGLFLLRPRRPATPPPAPAPSSVRPQPPAPPAPVAQTAPQASLPLKVPSPTAAQLRTLLEAWLAAKQSVLAGEQAPADLERIARPSLVDELRAQRRSDAARDQIQKIEASISDLSVQSRSANRIATRVVLRYRDRLLHKDGSELEVTAPTTLTNAYVFGRDDGSWRLAAFSPAD